MSDIFFKEAEEVAEEIVDRYDSTLKNLPRGCRVRLLTGKYEGRVGVLDGMCLDEKRGFLYLVMVLSVDETWKLNNEAETRSYRPKSEFEVVS